MVTLTLYYDPDDDCLFPSTEKLHSSYKQIKVSFEFKNESWSQIDGNNIDGFDLEEYNKVLKILNGTEYNAKHLFDSYGYML